MNKTDTILVTGGLGFLGRHLIETLRSQGYESIISPRFSNIDDFTKPEVVARYFESPKPDYVFHCAGKVGGIGGNAKDQHGAYLTNLRINTNVIEACVKAKVKKIVAMGSGAVYPDWGDGPFREEGVWLGSPHGSEYGYAQAKRAMLAQLEICKEQFGLDYAFAISANLYGPHDRFSVETGHAVPSLIRKFCESQQLGAPLTVWGDGSARRDFMHVKDAARALTVLMESLDGRVNVGSGEVHSIKDIISVLARHTKYYPEIRWDTDKPNGVALRSYDLTQLKKLDFACEYIFSRGIYETYDWYVVNEGRAKR